MDTSVELVKHLLQSVVYIHTTVGKEHPSTRILGNERLGSGVVVDASGLILTVNYVVMGGQTIYVAFQKGRRVKAELVAQDFEVGLALIRVKRDGLVAAELAPADTVERCDEVVLLGTMGPQERRVTGGLVTYIGEF
jgi:S1-C subfamily serine protease